MVPSVYGVALLSVWFLQEVQPQNAAEMHAVYNEKEIWQQLTCWRHTNSVFGLI